MNDAAFVQFRRLLLGVVVEVVIETGIAADLSGVTLAFEPESGFRFLWVDNWMRFRGWVRVPMHGPADPAMVHAVEERFAAVWPQIVGAFAAMPLVDRLAITRQGVIVTVGEVLEIRFDLEAD